MRRKLSVLLMLFASAALAGPPMICHPFQIDGAKSLPWAAGSDYNSPDPKYDVSKLPQDTLDLLAPDTPVIVRMETMRRAALYGVKDQRVEFELLARLNMRALEARDNPLALFDAGYLVETLKQLTWMYKRNLVEGMDGTKLVEQAIERGGDRPAMEFAASLMGERVQWPNQHFRNAVAGAKAGSLVARNLAAMQGPPAMK